MQTMEDPEYQLLVLFYLFLKGVAQKYFEVSFGKTNQLFGFWSWKIFQGFIW